MAYLVWKLLLKQYTRVKLEIQQYPNLLINPSQNHGKKLSSQNCVVQSSSVTIQVDDNETDIQNQNVKNHTSAHRSTSRVRSCLTKCKEVLIGQQSENDESKTKTVKNVENDKPTWYIEKSEPPDIQATSDCTNPPNNIVCIEKSTEKEIAHECNDETMKLKLKTLESGFQELLDKYLAELYPFYYGQTQRILVKRARDLLVCLFHGDIKAFEAQFLAPAAIILSQVKEKHKYGEELVWSKGWPLVTSFGATVIHLGPIEDSSIRHQDIFICIKLEGTEPKLCVCWRSSQTSKIIYHCIDPNKQLLSSLAIEMLADDLPQLLQNLLIGIENAISRIPFNDLGFPSSANNSKNDRDQFKTETTWNDKIISNSSKCALKRSDLITKNKTINNKYIMRKLPIKLENEIATTITNTQTLLPTFCLGGSFPHIDSDEENSEERTSKNEDNQLPHEIIAPRSILELPEKLLSSGIYLPGSHDLKGRPIITIEADRLATAGLNCYEVATVFLYYSTIPDRTVPFTILLIMDSGENCNIIDLVSSSLKLITNHLTCDEILTVYLQQNPVSMPSCKTNVKFVTLNDLPKLISLANIPTKCGGRHYHDQNLWQELFVTMDPFQSQCISTGNRLIAALSDIRASDLQGNPSRRQLYSQHRALSRALMDAELSYLRKRGITTINRMQELAKSLNKSNTKYRIVEEDIYENEDVKTRLNKVIVLYNEVDRAAKRLEHLTEQRREKLRELTRQRALEDEINEVSAWLKSDGAELLKKFSSISLECENSIKDHEQEFEKYYFMSMKHLAKGKDLHDAAIDLDTLKEKATDLKTTLGSFSERLEYARERVEGAARLHHLIGLHLKENDVQQEMQKLAEKIGLPSLLERNQNKKIENTLATPKNSLVASTPEKLINSTNSLCHCWREENSHDFMDPKGDQNDEDENNSKIADSGLGGCDHCESSAKLSRICSCQSFDDPGNLCDKSHSSDELEEDCFVQNSKRFLDAQSPIESNSHLQCHASNLELSQMEGLNGLDPKIQKTLLLIMREMIGTERDYVRSLYYVIENYMDELLKEDIPQPLRGQRNVIFGNIEKIFEFHQPHFLAELERYENSPLKVGAAFLENESKFYLYALYNKNKPKSDTLMSEFGTSLFKNKQIELNDKMDLASYLLKPVQRMGKYALLLQQLVKACNSVQGPAHQDIALDVEELQRAEEMVKFQLRHGNDLLAMDSLRDCDVNVKEQGRLLRQNEFLVWQGRGGKKSLRQIFLFEELILFSKARRFPDHKNLDIYIYKQSMKTSDIGLTAGVGDSTTKFEIWFRKRKPEDTWTLQSMSEDIKNAWIEEISKILWKQAKRNREIRLAEMSSMGIGNKPCLDIRPSNNQINDRSITITQLFKAPKFRNSFAGNIQEGKTPKRPSSLISESSSISSGASSSTLSTATSSSNGSSYRKHNGLELITESSSQIINVNKKHQRSTTIVSQISMESGIISDISITPETEQMEPTWQLDQKYNKLSNLTEKKKPIKQSEITLAEQEDPYLSSSLSIPL